MAPTKREMNKENSCEKWYMKKKKEKWYMYIVFLIKL